MPNFYNQNAQSYFAATAGGNTKKILAGVLPFLEKGATILDVGCGSGRDLKWLKEQGFRPAGIEKAPELADLAQKHSGCPVKVADFNEFDFSKQQFDAVLCVASLVHVEKDDLPAVIKNISAGVRTNGIFYLSLKEGEGKRKHNDGRIFTLWQTDELETLLKSAGLRILDFRRQVSQIRETDIWLGYVLKKG